MGAVVEVKLGMGNMGVGFILYGKEWKLPGYLYANSLVLGGELEEDMKVMVGNFVGMCKRRQS